MSDSTSPGQRFIQLIQQLGLSKNAFAQSLGKTATVIQHLVDERNKPGFDLLSKVLEVYPNVSSDWLLLGQGPMLRAEAPAPLFAEATPAEPGQPQRGGSQGPPIAVAAEKPATVEAPRPAVPAGTETALAATEAAPVPMATPAATAGAGAAPAWPAPALPDPAYLASLFQTQQLQHQLALAEQRSQHLLEQQALLKQMVQLLQRPV